MSMTVTQRRLRAVFLCAQCASILIFLLGLLLFWFALPVKVQAQMMMRTNVMECTQPVRDANPAIVQDGGEIIDLDEVQTAVYVAIVTNGSVFVRDVSSRIIVFSDGRILHILIYDGKLCSSATVQPGTHNTAIQAALGDPV